jgi:quercetin dioxygenase-like cupin family protein
VMLPGQFHPEQYHERKEETFHILYGDIELNLDGQSRACRPGDIVTVERGVKHAFKSNSGAVIEELSSTHYKDDSFYTDPAITQNTHRKTQLTYWLE